jgi:hypothetical protein
MSKAYFKIVFSILLAGILLVVLNAFIVTGTKKFYTHNYTKLEMIFDSSTYYDVLFIGSSRVHTAINPKIVDSVAGVSSFNAGIDGAGIPEFKMIFEGYLAKHPSPKKIVLTIDADSFDDIYKFFRKDLYLGFLNNRIVDTTLSQNGYTVLPYKVLPFLKMIEMNDILKRNAIVGLLFRKNELQGETEYKGYLSNGTGCIYPGIDRVYRYERYDMKHKSIAMLNSIIAKCKDKKIDLVLAYAPEYDLKLQGYVKNFDIIVNEIQNEAEKNSITFFRDDSLAICNNKCFFANYGHLNTTGATEYSIIWGNRLKDTKLQ